MHYHELGARRCGGHTRAGFRLVMSVRIRFDAVPWLADVGVGGLAPAAPFRIDLPDGERPTPHEPRRIIREDRQPSPRYFHQAKLGDAWTDVDEFTLEEMPEIDREVGN